MGCRASVYGARYPEQFVNIFFYGGNLIHFVENEPPNAPSWTRGAVVTPRL